MQYYIYIALPSELAKRVGAIRRRYPGQWRSLPHITLVIPRTLASKRTERELVRALRDAAATVAPFTIRHKGLACFGPKLFIYVPVHRTSGLRACRAACVRAVEGLLDVGLPDPFRRPHITLAGRMTPDEGKQAWRAVKRRSFDGQFVCRDIRLWRMGKNEKRWRLVSRFRLGG